MVVPMALPPPTSVPCCIAPGDRLRCCWASLGTAEAPLPLLRRVGLGPGEELSTEGPDGPGSLQCVGDNWSGLALGRI